jgi:protein-disulfide isomerase
MKLFASLCAGLLACTCSLSGTIYHGADGKLYYGTEQPSRDDQRPPPPTHREVYEYPDEQPMIYDSRMEEEDEYEEPTAPNLYEDREGVGPQYFDTPARDDDDDDYDDMEDSDYEDSDYEDMDDEEELESEEAEDDEKMLSRLTASLDAHSPDSVIEHISDGAPYIGAADADVTIVEFFDYSCSHCQRASATITAYHEAHPDVRIVFKPLSLRNKAPSTTAARYALAAERQGRFYEMHTQIMEMMHSKSFSEAALLSWADSQGYDVEALKAHSQDMALVQKIQENRGDAELFNFQMVPTFVIEHDDQVVVHPGKQSLSKLKRHTGK